MPTPRTVVFLMGTPGSGKSRLASQLQDRFGSAIIYDKDDLEEVTSDKTGPGSSFTKVEINKPSQYQTLINMIRKNVKHNNFFIIMGNFVGNKIDVKSSETAIMSVLKEFEDFQKIFLRIVSNPVTQYEIVKNRYESGIQVTKDFGRVRNLEAFLKDNQRLRAKEEEFIRYLKHDDQSLNYFELDTSGSAENIMANIDEEAYKLIAKIHFPSIKMDSSPIRLSPPYSSTSASSTPSTELILGERYPTPEPVSVDLPGFPVPDPVSVELPTTNLSSKPRVMTDYSNPALASLGSPSTIMTFLRAATATVRKEPKEQKESKEQKEPTSSNRPSSNGSRPRSSMYG